MIKFNQVSSRLSIEVRCTPNNDSNKAVESSKAMFSEDLEGPYGHQKLIRCDVR